MNLGNILYEYGADAATWRTALVSILLAYVLTQVIGMTYAWTYRGLSYSRSMVQALVVAGIVSAMLMLAIGNSLARGIGIVGTLALIRFRTNLRDPMDMVFVFAAFGTGIAAGTQSYATALIGTVIFLVVVTFMRLTSFGSQQQFDGVVRLRMPSDPDAELELQGALRKACRKFVLITLREVSQGETLERAYQVTLKTRQDEVGLVTSLSAVKGATDVTLSMQEATIEL